jgi:hypothetical protein
MAFKAIAFQEALQAGGVPEPQARAHAKAVEDDVAGDLVTNESMKQVLDARLAEMKFELVKWIVGAVGAATLTLLAAIIRFGVR